MNVGCCGDRDGEKSSRGGSVVMVVVVVVMTLVTVKLEWYNGGENTVNVVG